MFPCHFTLTVTVDSKQIQEPPTLLRVMRNFSLGEKDLSFFFFLFFFLRSLRRIENSHGVRTPTYDPVRTDENSHQILIRE